MSRLISILLLVVFGLPIASPLFALSTADAMRLHACCRRDGNHHCTAPTADTNANQRAPQLSAPAGKCPYCPAAVFLTHKERLALPIADAIFASLVGHPSAITQTESIRRISRDRARQKRGPPVASSLA